MRLTREYSRVSNSERKNIPPAVVPVERRDWPIKPDMSFSDQDIMAAYKYYDMPRFINYGGVRFLPSEKIAWKRKSGKLCFEYQAKYRDKTYARKPGEWWERGEEQPEYREEEEDEESGVTYDEWGWHGLAEEDEETGEKFVEMEERIWVTYDKKEIERA